MNANILILVGTGDSLNLANELCLRAEFKVYIFLDKRSRLRTNSKVAGEIPSLRNEEFFHRFLIDNGIKVLIDASPPFDKESTELCKRVSKLADIKLTHFLRPLGPQRLMITGLACEHWMRRRKQFLMDQMCS